MRSAIPYVAWLFCVLAPFAPAAGPASQPDGVGRLLQRLEQALQSGDPDQYIALLAPGVDRGLAQRFIAAASSPGATRVTVKERERLPLVGALAGAGYVIAADVLTESGVHGRLTTWRLEVGRRGDLAATTDEWAIQSQKTLASIQGLVRLTLDPKRQWTAHNVEVKAEDFELRLPQGNAFVAYVDGGTTALVLLGHGEMVFSPSPAIERGQIKILCGAETLRTAFDAVMVRFEPSRFASIVSTGGLTERPVDPAEFRRADAVFRTEVAKSFTLNLSDMTTDTWSVLPRLADIVAEVRTRRFGTLTYAKAADESEDITLFDRARHRNLSIYRSKEKLARLGRFYDEDALAEYEVLHYDVEATFSPNRLWMDGLTTMRLRVRAAGLSSLTLKLAESVTVRSVVAAGIGRLLAVPIRGQNSVAVNFPSSVGKGTLVILYVSYAGRIEPQLVDREALASQDQERPGPAAEESPPMEGSYLYSNHSYWYAQAPSGNYATANIRLTVPTGYRSVASGDPVSVTTAASPGGKGNQTTYVFAANRPVRYLACLVSRLVPVRDETLIIPGPTDGDAGTGGAVKVGETEQVSYSVQANARQQSAGRELASRASDIFLYYASLVGDCPYPSLAIGIVERPLPAGHSPAYMIALSLPTGGAHYDWSRDPASLPDFPDFFIAHEVAHQWWGQAVGWKNYHEQWLSEGFAQYFAVLYAAHDSGADVLDGIIRHLHRTAMARSADGPIYLGYRVGHIKADGRAFRAIVYNKGAAVLHMLRLLIGDEAFFRGIRRFYSTWQFKKAGTDDLRVAFEAEAGRSLSRFFERWVYEAALPVVRFSYRTEQRAGGSDLVVRFQQSGEVFDFPVVVSIDYSNGESEKVMVAVTDQVTEKRIPLRGAVRRVDANRDAAALVDLVR